MNAQASESTALQLTPVNASYAAMLPTAMLGVDADALTANLADLRLVAAELVADRNKRLAEIDEASITRQAGIDARRAACVAEQSQAEKEFMERMTFIRAELSALREEEAQYIKRGDERRGALHEGYDLQKAANDLRIKGAEQYLAILRGA